MILPGLSVFGAILPLMAQGAGSAYPAGPVVAAFTDVCRNPKDRDALEARAQLQAWVSEAPASGTTAKRILVTKNSFLTSEFLGKSPRPVASFRRIIGGRQLWLFVSTEPRGGKPQTFCEIDDLSAGRAEFEAVRLHIGRLAKNTSTGEQSNEMAFVELKSGVVEGATESLVAYTPDDGSDFFVPGVAFSATRSAN